MTLNYDDFDYKINYEHIEEYLKSRTKNDLISIILDIDKDDYLFEYLKDELTEYFEDEAREQHEDYMLYKKDPLGYYGMSESDFL